ncbi:MAG: CotH kinase family protein, partial [Clostridia bacterium]|nr:CotH kinase family protein [Clostridia bacterium]
DYENTPVKLVDLTKANGEIKVKVTYDSNDGSKLFFECKAKIKVQGSSSSKYPKKNFTIKFFSNTNCTKKYSVDLGWGKENHYCMKANWVDSSHARNIVGARIFSEIVVARENPDENLIKAPNNGLIDGYPVAVYVNGEFHGLYTMNIPKDAWQFGMEGGEESKEAMFMSDGWLEYNRLYTEIGPNKFKEYKWEVEHCSTEVQSWIRDSFNELIRVLNCGDEQRIREELPNHLDIEAAIDTFLFTYFLNAFDNRAKNMLWVTYDGTLWIPSMYDMDSTFGSHWDGTEAQTNIVPQLDESGRVIFGSNGNRMYDVLMAYYPQEIEDRWNYLRQDILTIENVRENFESIWAQIPEGIWQAELEKWPDIPNCEENRTNMFEPTEAQIARLDAFFCNFGSIVNAGQNLDTDTEESTSELTENTESEITETTESATTETTEPATTETTDPATTETTELATTETTESATTETTEPATTETTEPATTETTEPETTETETETETQSKITVLAESRYYFVGQQIVLLVEGDAEELGTLSVTVSAPELVGEYVIEGTEITIPSLSDGIVEITVQGSTQKASCVVEILADVAVDIELDDPNISYLGRHETNAQGYVVMNNTAAGFEVRFYGTELTVTMSDGKYPNDAHGTGLAVFVDGETDPTANIIHLHRDGVAVNGGRKITLCSFEEAGWHTVKVQKITEEDSGYAKLMAMTVTGRLANVETKYDLKIMVFGDSITTGYGNMRGEGVADGLTTTTQNGLLTYATIAAAQLNADVHVFAKQGIGLYTNPYGHTRYLKDIYGKVSPLSETDWDMTSWVPDIVVINVGTNDAWTDVESKATNGNVVFSQAGYQAAYIEMIRGLTDVWGKDVVFFLCYDMMSTNTSNNTNNNTFIGQAINQVRFSLKREGITVVKVQLPRATNGGHPLKASHETAATMLVTLINNNYVNKE